MPEDDKKNELPNMRIGGAGAGVSQGNSKFPLGHLVLWGVSESLAPESKVDEITTRLHLASFDRIGDYTAACRAVKVLECTTHVKPPWDVSSYTPMNGVQEDGKKVTDTIVYGTKSVPGQEFILHRTIYRKTVWMEEEVVDGKTEVVHKDKTQRIPENIARIYHIPARYRTEKKQKVLVRAAYVMADEYNTEHPILGEAGLAALQEKVRADYVTYQNNFISDDIRKWMKDRLNEMTSLAMRISTTFVPWEYRDELVNLRNATVELSSFRTFSRRCTTHMEFLEVENVDAKAKWIADTAAAEAAEKFKKMFNEVAELLAEASKVENPEARQKREIDILETYVTDLNEDAEYREKYVRLLNRKIDLCVEYADGGPDVTKVPSDRWELIAGALRRSKVTDDIQDIFKNGLPTEEDIRGDTGRNLRKMDT